MKPLKGSCAHCGKETTMDDEKSWELKWDTWKSKLEPYGWARTLCNDCCIKLHAFLNCL